MRPSFQDRKRLHSPGGEFQRGGATEDGTDKPSRMMGTLVDECPACPCIPGSSPEERREAQPGIQVFEIRGSAAWPPEVSELRVFAGPDEPADAQVLPRIAEHDKDLCCLPGVLQGAGWRSKTSCLSLELENGPGDLSIPFFREGDTVE